MYISIIVFYIVFILKYLSSKLNYSIKVDLYTLVIRKEIIVLFDPNLHFIIA